MDLLNSKDSRVFKVNGQRLNPYAVQFATYKEEIPLLEPERLPCVGVDSIKAKKHSNFCCDFIWIFSSFICAFPLFVA